MELRHLRYFVRAAELLHFTHAAESLYISQPTLSTHIQQLEDEVGVPLFNRVGRHVELTRAGKLFLEYGKGALDELDLAKQKLEDMKYLRGGTLRIGALLTFGPEVLPGWLTSFHKKYPQVRVSVTTGTSDLIEEELQAGAVDIGLSFVPSAADSLQNMVLYTEPIYLVVNTKHRLAAEKSVNVKAIASLPLALVSRGWAARRVVDAVLAENKVAPNVVLEIDDLKALLSIVAAGGAAALLARFAIADFPGVVSIPVKESRLSIDYGVLWSTQTHLSPSATAFLDQIRSQSKR